MVTMQHSQATTSFFYGRWNYLSPDIPKLKRKGTYHFDFKFL
jgi:hypothetical protein